MAPMRHIVTLIWLALPLTGAARIAILVSGDLPLPARYGLAKIEDAARRSGYAVDNSAKSGDFLIKASIGGRGLARPESLSIHHAGSTLELWGADARGLMYAALEAAERLSPGSDPFREMRDVRESPYLAERGISIYTMQRAWFESRLYDERYWQRYFDMLAADRINSFVVIFGYENGGFMAPLYPYFFNVPGFPQVEMVGLTAAQQARNTAAFRALIRLAHGRGIEVTAGIWDHIYRGGVQGGGIPGASGNAGKRVPGLVWGVTAENLAAYNQAALRKFLEVFPEIDAVQFRMHDESGLKKSEVEPFWHEVFTSVRDNHPNLKLDLRAKELPDAVIEDALRLGLRARVSTKYWMEQMGLPFHPTHINTQDQRNRRHGYADLLRYPPRYKLHWQLWSGGTTRVLLWGDPEYVRRFAASARLYGGDSFEVNEMLATWMLGEAHDTAPLPVLNETSRYTDYEFERYWHFYRVWGRLTYNPEASADVWEREWSRRFGKAGSHLMNALHTASWVLPRIVASSYRYQNFPTTRGWAEMNHQGSLPQYAAEEGSDIQQFLNPRDEARLLVAGGDTAMRRPEENSRWFAAASARILDEVARAGETDSKEFRSTVTDLRILAGLTRYHSRRLLAGVAYNLWKETGSLGSFDQAIAEERAAIEAWRDIVAAAGDVYSEQLALGAHAVGFRRHWKEEYGLIESEFNELMAERRAAVERPGARHVTLASGENRPPTVTLKPIRGLVVSAAVERPAEVKSVRLRYRHLTQFEDYQTAEMKRDARSGLFEASIPASFVNPAMGLMYFVEVVDRGGNGRMYPDLDSAAPYVVVEPASASSRAAR